MNQQIFVYKDGQQYGPFTPQEAWEMVLKGQFNPDTDSAWHEGISDWLPLKEVILQVAPPAQPTKDEPPKPSQAQPVTPLKVGSTFVKPKVVVGILMVVVVLIVIGVSLSGRSSAQTAAATTNPPSQSATSQLPTQDAVANTDKPTSTNAALFTGKWHYVQQGDDGNPTLIINVTSDGENIKTESWLPSKQELVKLGGAISFPKKGTFTDGNVTPDDVRVASFQDSTATHPSFLITAGDGKYVFCLGSDSNKIIDLTPGLMNIPANDTVQAPSVADYYGEYRGKTAAYNVKDKDGNDVLNNGSPIVVRAFDTDVKFTSTGIEVSEINDNSDIISMLSQGSVQVNSGDANSVTISVTVVQSLNAKLSASKPSYKFVFNKDGTGKMIPLSEQNAPTIDLLKDGAANQQQTASPKNDANNDTSALIGTWAYSFGQDGNTTTIRLSIHSDGTYELSCPGNGGDSYSHGTWRIRGNGTVSLNELVGDSSVPVTGDECSLPKDGTIQLNTSHLQKNIFLKKE